MLTDRTNLSLVVKYFYVAAFLSAFAAMLYANAQDENDPHRPVCSTALCRKVKSYLKRHYCGESPAGNGPDDGCEIKLPKQPQAGVEVEANYRCEWNDAKRDRECKQSGQPSASVRGILLQELGRLGLPANANGETHFDVLKSVASGWSVAGAAYSHASGDDLEICEVIVLIDKDSHPTVLRKLAFQKTDIDVPKVTQWFLVDLADVDGDGQLDVILEGDAYENHWLEVFSLQSGSPRKMFSGLGYYL